MLIDSLNEMLSAGVDDVRLVEIEEEANKMKSHGMYADACNVLGMIASLRMNIQEVDKYFKAAIAHAGRDVATLINYAVALANAYQYRRAVEIIDEAVESAPGDAGLIKVAIDLHAMGFDAEGARRLADRLLQLGEHLNDPIPFDVLDEYEAAFSAADTSWETVADIICVAATAVSLVVKRPTAGSTIHDGVVLFRFIVDATNEDAFMAESEMIKALANEPYNPADRAIYFSCATA